MKPDEFLDNAFGKTSEDEKIEHFEQSTIKLLLQRLGWNKAQIASYVTELGPAFDCAWFNELSTSRFPIYVDRCFHFNIQDLLLKPLKCELLKQFHTRMLEEGHDELAVVFKSFNLGRIVVSHGLQRALGSPPYQPYHPCIITVCAPGVVVDVHLWDTFCRYHFHGEESDNE